MGPHRRRGDRRRGRRLAAGGPLAPGASGQEGALTGSSSVTRLDPEGSSTCRAPDGVGKECLLDGPDVFFRGVVEGMRCGIVTVDQEGCVLTVNELAREILELDEPVAQGRPVRDALARHPRLAEVLIDALEMSQLPNRAEMEIRSREDDGRTIGFTISPIVAEGRQLGVALFFKDLTQVERQEEQDRLRDRLAALGQMAASLAHEIRNPLASIEVMATLLRRKLARCGAGDDALASVEKIAAEVARLNQTVTRGLEFARPIAPEMQRRSLAAALDEALAEARARFPDSQVIVERRYDPQAPDVEHDPALMRQVFTNILVNAYQAVGEEGKIEVDIRPVARPQRQPGAVDVTIRDDGPGIPPEVRDKIFYPFVTTKEGGSGIGLAMARKIVECHHGMIDVSVGEQGGTAFTLRLPVAVDDGQGRG
ncbi:MAG: ATP-binding protein [Acidobacteriota bacterium]|nr:ATP-binding protein [Acidobacteriota bacterium]MDQ7087023.1 ATP-binding protein [Acidobacteriota bacterium]